MKRFLAPLMMVLLVPATCLATHEQAAIGDAIDGDGNGVFTGSYTHDDTEQDHPWYTFDATTGDVVTIDLDAPFATGGFGTDSYLWVYSVVNAPAQVGDQPGTDLQLVLNSGSGAAVHNLVLNVAATGQYAVQIDSWLGGSGDYELTIAGATSAGVVPEPGSLAIFGAVAVVGVFHQRRRKRSKA